MSLEDASIWMNAASREMPNSQTARQLPNIIQSPQITIAPLCRRGWTKSSPREKRPSCATDGVRTFITSGPHVQGTGSNMDGQLVPGGVWVIPTPPRLTLPSEP